VRALRLVTTGNGALEVRESELSGPGEVLLEAICTLISPGTELAGAPEAHPGVLLDWR
jgi:hypothetical protein